MKRHVATFVESWPIRGSFTISRGSKTDAEVIVCKISAGGHTGWGECVPYARYGESLNSVAAQIAAVGPMVVEGADHSAVLAVMPPGAARNAVDCAFWDLEAKSSGVPVHKVVCARPPGPVVTAVTISLGDLEGMAREARKQAHRPLLKVKLGGKGDIDRIHAVTAAAPASKIILDANEGWSPDNIADLMKAAATANVVLIEQPLPAGKDAILAEIPHPVPVCADESAHVSSDLAGLVGRYDCINIKLDKTGGLTEAAIMHRKAKEMGFTVMIGCMVGTSLAMAPAILLAQDAEFIDLDGPLILEKDRTCGLSYSGSVVSPPMPQLWG